MISYFMVVHIPKIIFYKKRKKEEKIRPSILYYRHV